MLPSASGKIVGAFGVAISAIPLILVGVSPWVRARLLMDPPALLQRWETIAIALIPFLGPAAVVHSSPAFGFWRVDGRSALLIAWLMSVTLAIVFEHQRQGARNRTTSVWLLSLFILFSAGVWLTIVLDTGITSLIVGIDRLGSRPCQSDSFRTMITVWESNAISDHLFLAWRSQADFDQRFSYANHVHPYLFLMYGWIALARALGGLTLWQATNTSILLPVAPLVLAFGALLARTGLLWHRTRLRDLLVLFLAIGILLTTWRLWIDLVRFNNDNPFPLQAAVLVFVYAMLLPPVRTAGAATAAAIFAALGPVHTPMVLLPTLCLFGQGGENWRDVLRRNRSVAIVCGVTLVVGVLSYIEPRLLISLKGYRSQESSFLFRSGLDGDTRYFSSLIQAAVAPCPISCCYLRTLSDLLFPALLPLAVFGALTIRREHPSAPSIGRALLFLTTPYLVSLILFPQSVSVHPYLYDHLLIIPVVVTGLLAMLAAPVQRRLTGAGLLLFLLFVAGILMSNLIAITQGLARAIAYFTH